ncbi:ABC transporter permease [Deinococcus yavapaiensis]|uniref:Peptide/nickel transport system permease protein n=1 Tax=Deinococcus yavapaiensis KR-236 TaxID=694435 RepID=A0A318S2J4_9DEIO|nr:ABC transporter permease [Deinococcus yavapaiensis]PYE49878.1 peptide/nickel transport system permease protein [Deinococcus yavapaiensis KR-236]
MTSFLIRRVLRTLLVVLGITLVVFAFVRAIPGDPATVILGERATPESVARLRTQLGLDQPIPVQFGKFVADIARGDLGAGIKSQVPVVDDLRTRFPATFELTIGAILFAILVGLPAGIIAALNRNKFLDNAAMTISLVGVSMPVFWLGMLLAYFFAVKLQWLPPSARLSTDSNIEPITGLFVLDGLLRGQFAVAWEALRHLILPSVALGTIPMAIIARITRSAMLEVLSQDYIRTAAAKGVSRTRVVVRHALRNAMLPVVTVIGLQIGALLGGAVLTETIFSWPGLGSWLYQGIFDRDYPVIQGGVIFAALVVSVVNLAVDLSYAFLDPRIHYS